MFQVKDRGLYIVNIIFAIPIVISLISELIFFCVIYPLKLYNGPWQVLGFPMLIGYYLFPFIGWAAIIPILTNFLSIKKDDSILLRIFFGLLLVIYFGILVYTIWWWVTKQQFVFL